MQFAGADRLGVAEGRITLAFRRWAAARVVAGRVYRTSGGRVRVEEIRAVRPEEVTDAEARAAGRPDAAALLAALRGDPASPLWRIAIAPAGDADPRAELAADDALTPADVEAVRTRLQRLDKASSYGPWTGETLAAIATRPGVRAPDLAASFGRETAPFKLDVRKLKNLGLTHSLGVGYELSPRGRAYLAATFPDTVVAPTPPPTRAPRM